MAKHINLPENYFHCPTLSRREHEYLITTAQDAAKTLVEGTRSAKGPIRWSEAGSHHGVQMYKGEARNASVRGGEHVNYACGAVSVNATLEEVAEFFDVSTTPTMKSFASTQDDIVDGVVLYTLVAPTPENQNMHQITLKWFLASMPSRLIKPRDFVTLECQDVFVDTTGRRGWVRSYHSVKLPCCPDLQQEMGFVRGSFYHSGYVFVESEKPGWLDCVFSMQVDLKGNLVLPSALYWISMKSRISSVAKLTRELHQRRLGKQTFLSDLELVPKTQRAQCHVCCVTFGMLTRKTRCRKCGEVICHQCSQLWDISVPKYGTKRVRVCSACCLMVATSDASARTMDGISSLHSDRLDSTSNTSSSDRVHTPERERFRNAYATAQVESTPQPTAPPYGDKGIFDSPARAEEPTSRYHQLDSHHHDNQNKRVLSTRNIKPRTFDKTYVTDETASLSSELLSASQVSEDRGLTPNALEQHTRQMGPPGPVTRQDIVYPPPPLAPRRQDYYGFQSMHHPPGGDHHQSHHQYHHQYQSQYQQSQSRYAPPPPFPRAMQSYHEGDDRSWTQQSRYMPPGNSYSYGPERRFSVSSEAPSELYREFHDIPPPPPPPPSHSIATVPARSTTAPHKRPPSDDTLSASSRGSTGMNSPRNPLATTSVVRPAPPSLQLPPQCTRPPLTTDLFISSCSDKHKQQATTLEPATAGPTDTAKTLDDRRLDSPVSEAIVNDFSTRLRIEDARITMGSYRYSVHSSSAVEPSIHFCDTLHDDLGPRDHRTESIDSIDDVDFRVGPVLIPTTTTTTTTTATTNKVAAAKLAVVQVYEQILQLTRQQHALESSPEAEHRDKTAVAEQIQTLYATLNALTNPRSEIEI